MLLLHRSTSGCTKAVFQSNFSKFLCRFTQNLFINVQMYLILNNDICSLLVRIDCVAVKPE